jgi:hypothetical protein
LSLLRVRHNNVDAVPQNRRVQPVDDRLERDNCVYNSYTIYFLEILIIDSNSRKEKRELIERPVFFAINGLAQNYWARSRNLSKNGLALNTNHPIKVGCEYLMHSKDLWHSTRSAKVMWCKKVDKDTYFAGLSTSN